MDKEGSCLWYLLGAEASLCLTPVRQSVSCLVSLTNSLTIIYGLGHRHASVSPQSQIGVFLYVFCFERNIESSVKNDDTDAFDLSLQLRKLWAINRPLHRSYSP